MSAPISGPYETEREVTQTPQVQAVYAAFDAAPGAGRMRPHNLAMLEDACAAADVAIGAYDSRILGWLSGWEPETCAVVVGLIARAHQAAVGSVREHLASLADHIDRRVADEHADRQEIAEDAATHLRMLARGARPAVTLDPVQLDRVLDALADAATYRKRQAGEACADCDAAPDSVCGDHMDDLDLADAYDTMAADLRQEAGR